MPFMGSFSAGFTKEQVEQIVDERMKLMQETLRKISFTVSKILEKQDLTLEDLEPIKRMANEWNQEE